MDGNELASKEIVKNITIMKTARDDDEGAQHARPSQKHRDNGYVDNHSEYDTPKEQQRVVG